VVARGARQPPAPDRAEAAELHLEGLTLLDPSDDRPAVRGLTLTFGGVGVAITGAGPNPRVLAWGSVETLRVDPWGDGGAVVSVRGPGRTYRFVAPGQDPVTLGFVLEGIRRPPPGPRSVAAATAPGPRPRGPRHRGGRGRRGASGLDRWRPFLVVALIVVLAGSVALVLAQSAGAIHLPLLGGSGATVRASALGAR